MSCNLVMIHSVIRDSESLGRLDKWLARGCLQVPKGLSPRRGARGYKGRALTPSPDPAVGCAHTKMSRQVVLKMNKKSKCRTRNTLRTAKMRQNCPIAIADYMKQCEDEDEDYESSLTYPKQLEDLTSFFMIEPYYLPRYFYHLEWNPLTDASRCSSFWYFLRASFVKYDCYFGVMSTPFVGDERKRKQRNVIWVLKHCCPTWKREDWRPYFDEVKKMKLCSDEDRQVKQCDACKSHSSDLECERRKDLCQYLDETLELLCQ